MRVVKYGFPNAPAVRRLPNTAARCAEIINCRLARNARDRSDSPRAMRADQPPLHGVERIRIILLSEGNGSNYYGRKRNEKETYKPIHVEASDDGGQFIIHGA